MTLRLLDTNIVSDLVRNPQGKVAQRITETGDRDIVTSIIVACELRYGVEKLGSPRLAQQVETVLGALVILSLESEVDHRYAAIRTHLERQGSPIGANDMLIAAHALYLGAILITDNQREFARVPGLEVENWLR